MKKTPLSNKTREIILGSLLGDGSLKIHKSYKNARFSFRHSKIQKEYFFWKAYQLNEIAGTKSIWKQGSIKRPDGWGTEKYRFQSKVLPSLSDIHLLTHKGNHKKIRRKWLNQMTELSLLIWWLDDGSLVSDTRQGVFCTDSFSLEEVKILDKYMKKVWGVSTSVHQTTKPNSYRLWIRSSEDLKKFLRIIMPYLKVENMLPKVLLLYKDLQFQQRWISEVSFLTGFSVSLIEKYVKFRKSKLRLFRK